MWGFLIAILSGILMSTQGVWNTQTARQTSLWVSASFVQLTALLICLAACFFSGQTDFFSLGNVHPRYLLLGGVLGALITATVIGATAQLGPAGAAMVIVVSQIAGSYLIQLLGLFGVEKQPPNLQKIAALCISILGVLLFHKK